MKKSEEMVILSNDELRKINGGMTSCRTSKLASKTQYDRVFKKAGTVELQKLVPYK